jgi:hypothetical protein
MPDRRTETLAEILHGLGHSLEELDLSMNSMEDEDMKCLNRVLA